MRRCFSLPLSRRTNDTCARLCWFQSARRLAFERNTRERDERERFTRKRQFRSSREKRSHHHRLVFGRQKHVLFASSSVHFSHQKRQKAQMMILCTTPSFVLCFLSRSHIFDYSPIHSLSLSVSLSGDCLFTNKQQASWNWRTKTARNLSKFRKKLDTTGTRNN